MYMLIATVSAFLVGVILTLAINRLVRRVGHLEVKVKDLQDNREVEELREMLGRKRHTNSTDAGIMDIMAQLTRIDVNLAEMEARIRTSRILADSAWKRAGIVRQGPYAYDKETPSEE
jgi:hypothetical protein